MKEHFYQSETISDEAIKELIQKSDHPAMIRFVIMYSLFVGFGIWVVYSWGGGSIWQQLVSVLGFGIIHCSLFACEHETVHATAFKSRTLNKIAAFLCGIGQIYPPSVFKELHYAHHRHTHEPGLDPEISFGGKPIPSVISNPPMYLSWLTGFPLFFAKFLFTIVGVLRVPEFLRKALFPFIRPAVKGRIFVEAWVIFIIYASFVYLAIYVNAGFWGLFVGQVVGHCILAVYLVPEHNGLPHEGTILEKTRSVNTTSIVKLVMWNMPYHAEHHAYPAVPFHALPDLNKVMAEDLIHNKEGHTAVHLKVMKHTVSGSEFEV